MEKLYTDYKNIWHTHNPSGNLDNMIVQVKGYLKNYDYALDSLGNIFIGDFSKNIPCLVAHLDSVHDKKSKKFKFDGNILSSNKGVGGDDKCGIVAILEILKRGAEVNAIFPVDEEIGGIGASNIEPEILANVSYFIEIDRNGNDDIIYNSGYNQIASDEFQKALEPFAEKYGFTEGLGTYTDVNELTEISEKSAINISAGYYNAHRTNEYVNLTDLENTIRCVLDMVQNVRLTYKWEDTFQYNEYVHQDDYFLNNDKDWLDNSTDLETLEGILQKAYTLNLSEIEIELICKAYDIGYWEARTEVMVENKRGNGRGKKKFANN